ncbi:MAG: hypothetical protein KKD38_04510 [Candidatus Delongbacteria bacterium]|nr:hypothetical protein [Candidatus Delongbacteria bacterium]MCG2760637.1 hypothetical protein [Candidatus Delongbacteria bacterium]
MKKEIFYIAIPIILSLSGVVYKSMFLSGTIQNTQVLLDSNNDMVAKFNKDCFIQTHINLVKKNYIDNRRDTRTYGEVIADLLKITENILQKSNIQYKGNDINQDFDEVKDFKNGISSAYINITFTTEYNNLKKFLAYLEQNTLIINVIELEISRTKQKPDENTINTLIDQGIEFDEFNVKAMINVRIRLEFVKYL